MARNLVVCMDGTGNAPKADGNTNVLRLYGMLDLTDESRQIAFYTPGVGTRGDPAALTSISRGASRARGIVTGYGMNRDLADAYKFIADNYRAGDRIFIFGFSRGAFAALALAGACRAYGLVHYGAENMIGLMVSGISKPTRKSSEQGLYKFRQRFCREHPDGAERTGQKWALPIHFLGLWDTVKALKYLRFVTAFREGPAKKWYIPSWPFTREPHLVSTIRHAVSIDDRRLPYDVYNFAPDDEVDFEEVWFAGVHSDVGGAFDKDGENDLGRIALKWMVEAAVAKGLIVPERTYEAKCFKPAEGGGVESFSADGKVHRNSIVWLPLGIRRRIGRRRSRQRFLEKPVWKWFEHLPDEEIRVHQRVLDRDGYKIPAKFKTVPADPKWQDYRPTG